mmetsp:Transcript_2015/g.4389  ORF Transcript_2015/g.4389 Transcript_2015/m.4389 type:complete len:481 (-) Transcript_2015:132-1574(-)
MLPQRRSRTFSSISTSVAAFLVGALLLLTSPLLSFANKLPGHSIANPPDINALVADWWMGGTTIPSTKATVLSSGVRNRVGSLWSMYPLLTNSFEATFKIKATKPATRGSKNGGFAFWLAYENATQAQLDVMKNSVQKQEDIIADAWPGKLKDAGFDLLGYRSKYNGLGLFFLDDDAPSVSVVPNDGSKTFQIGAGLPTYDATKVDWTSGNEVTVKLKVGPESAEVEFVGFGSVSVKSSFKSMGYLGFTSFGGETIPEVKAEQAPIVELLGLEVINLDTASAGEEVHTTPAPTVAAKPEDKVDVFAEASSFKDHRAESDAIKELTNLVFKLVVETQPVRQQMAKSLETLSKRVSVMEDDFKELKDVLDKKTGHKLGEEFENIKKELASLSTAATQETKKRRSSLDSLHADIADMHKSAHSPDTIDKHLDKLTQSNLKVLDQLNNEHQTMFGVSLGAIAFIIIAGLSLYNKFRCWEKKHVL